MTTQPATDASELLPASSPATEVGALALTTMKPEEYAAAVFKPFNDKFDTERAAADLIVFSEAQLLELADDVRPKASVIDITTTVGMDIAIKYRAIFRDEVRLDSEKAFKLRKAPVLSIGRLLDAGKKKIEDAVAPYESKFHNAIKAEEDRKAAVKAEKERIEAERIAAIRAKITAIQWLPAQNVGATSAQLHEVLSELAKRPIMAEEFAELTAEARAAVDVAGRELESMYGAAKVKEQAEADRMAAIEEQRVAMEAQAEANRIEKERLAAVAEEVRKNIEAQAAKFAADEAERKRIEAIADGKRARVAADTKRQLDAQAAAVEAQRKEVAAAAQAEEDKMAAARSKLAVDVAAFEQAKADAASLEAARHAAHAAPVSAVPTSIVLEVLAHGTVPAIDPADELREVIDAVPIRAEDSTAIACLHDAVRELARLGFGADAIRALVESVLA